MPRAPPSWRSSRPLAPDRCDSASTQVPINQKSPGTRVVQTLVSGLFPLPTCFNRSAFPGACAPEETLRVDSQSNTRSRRYDQCFHTSPAIRFQQAVDLELKVNDDLERRVQRLDRQLNPVPPVQPHSVRRATSLGLVVE